MTFVIIRWIYRQNVCCLIVIPCKIAGQVGNAVVEIVEFEKVDWSVNVTLFTVSAQTKLHYSHLYETISVFSDWPQLGECSRVSRWLLSSRRPLLLASSKLSIKFLNIGFWNWGIKSRARKRLWLRPIETPPSPLPNGPWPMASFTAGW